MSEAKKPAAKKEIQSETQVEKPAVQQQLLSVKPKSPRTPPQNDNPTVIVEEIENKQQPTNLVKPPAREKFDPVKIEDGDRKPPPRPSFQKPIRRQPQPPPYKNLDQFITSNGDTFFVGEEIKITTTNHGEYNVVIKFLYEASDGSVWASYSHADKEERHPWRWGCCRVDLLQKPSDGIDNEP